MRLSALGLGGSLLACSSDDDASEQGTNALQPGEPTELLPYTCAADETRASTPADAAGVPSGFRDTGRTMGVAVSEAGLQDPAYAATVAAQFDQVTAENE